jgi:pantoate--beta-alanine ligase
MIIYKNAADIDHFLSAKRRKREVLGFVPTMGALHRGHLELVKQALEQTSLVTVSIFVNPTQFNDPGDFKKYPVTLENDIKMLHDAGAHILFLPSVAGIYPDGTVNLPTYDLGGLEKILEGKFRPGHFQGVCQVMHRLMDIVRPNFLFMGQKDYQQCMVVKKLLQLTGSKAKLVVCPTVRESGGLAMSSRNMRLSEAERNRANLIYQTLAGIREKLSPGPVDALIAEARHKLETAGYRVDYVEIADATTLEACPVWDGRSSLVALVALFAGEVRLIDNLTLN